VAGHIEIERGFAENCAGKELKMFVKSKSLIIIFFISIFFISCDGGKMAEQKVQYDFLNDVSASSWEKLSKKKIYFGHQSVGFNIIEGLKDLMKENPQIKLNIVETNNLDNFNKGIFAHSRVGKNVDPKSKIEEFAKFTEQGIGENADIAFFKFCYVDVRSETDSQKVFDDYRQSMSNLTKKYPKTTFIHITVPLRIVQTGPKAWIKKIIGRPAGGYDDNIKRSEFNELLIKEYDGKETIYDLAKIESTRPDGTRETFSKDGKTYYAIVPDYTYDGGHLNETGRKKAAEQLLILLTSLATQ